MSLKASSVNDALSTCWDCTFSASTSWYHVHVTKSNDSYRCRLMMSWSSADTDTCLSWSMSRRTTGMCLLTVMDRAVTSVCECLPCHYVPTACSSLLGWDVESVQAAPSEAIRPQGQRRACGTLCGVHLGNRLSAMSESQSQLKVQLSLLLHRIMVSLQQVATSGIHWSNLSKPQKSSYFCAIYSS